MYLTRAILRVIKSRIQHITTKVILSCILISVRLTEEVRTGAVMTVLGISTTYSCWLKSYNNSLLARKRRKKKRILWSAINERISDIRFRRMFRMSRDYFDSLCQRIISPDILTNWRLVLTLLCRIWSLSKMKMNRPCILTYCPQLIPAQIFFR